MCFSRFLFFFVVPGVVAGCSMCMFCPLVLVVVVLCICPDSPGSSDMTLVDVVGECCGPEVVGCGIVVVGSGVVGCRGCNPGGGIEVVCCRRGILGSVFVVVSCCSIVVGCGVVGCSTRNSGVDERVLGCGRIVGLFVVRSMGPGAVGCCNNPLLLCRTRNCCSF